MLHSFCLVVVLALGQSPDATGCKALAAKLQHTDPRNPTELLALGQECQDARCGRLARLAYERVLKLGENRAGKEAWCEASFHLAEVELEAKEYDAAFSRLRFVASHCDHNAARALLNEAESKKTHKQLSLVSEGDEFLAQGKVEAALRKYEMAFKLSPDAPTAAAYVPRKTILEKIAECRNRIDDIRFQRIFLPQRRSVASCSKCAGSAKKGFLKCPTCGGSGGKWVVLRLGRFSQKKWRWCTPCGGHKFQGCSECYMLGFTSPQIALKEKRALKALVGKVTHPRLFRKPLEPAIEAVEKELLGVKEGASLNYLRAMKPEYALSRKLRQALGSVPPTGIKLSDAADAWREEEDNFVKVNFLLNYACEFAEYLNQFEMLRGSQIPEPEALFGSAPRREETLSPQLLAAFPDESRLSRVAVEGTLLECSLGAAEESKGYVKLRDAGPQGVKFFVWTPAATARLERLSKGPWKRSLQGFVENYPFDLWKRLRPVPKDHKVILVGRFLRDPFGFPRNWFEVWQFEVGLSSAQEEAFLALRGPEDVSFEGNSLKQVAKFFQDWRDLVVEFDGVSNTLLVDCLAEDCPRGLVLDALARAVGAAWYYRDGHVVFCRKGQNPQEEDTAEVLAHLQKERTPETKLVARRAKLERKPELTGLEDPAGLRIAAEEAKYVMDYRLADQCYRTLAGKVQGTLKQQAIRRARQKMRLFEELTGRTPVSKLVGALELTRLTYQKPNGDFVKPRTLRVVDKQDNSWSLQEPYGVRFSIDPKDIKKDVPVSVLQWRRQKAEELEQLKKVARGAEDTAVEGRVRKLCLLAAYAKTYKFDGEGTEFLNQAIESATFEEYLEQYYPSSWKDLARIWRNATGRSKAQEAPSSLVEPMPERPAAPAAPVPKNPILAIPANLSDGELLSRAMEYRIQGCECTRRILDYPENTPAWRNRAITYFKRARDAVERYLGKRPQDPSAQRLKRSLDSLINGCLKDWGFFEDVPD